MDVVWKKTCPTTASVDNENHSLPWAPHPFLLDFPEKNISLFSLTSFQMPLQRERNEVTKNPVSRITIIRIK